MSYDPNAGQNPYEPPVDPGFSPSARAPNNILPALALATGLAGLFTAMIGFCCCPAIGIPLPAVAIGLGFFGMREAPDQNSRSMAIVGLVLGIVGLAISVIYLVIVIVAIAQDASTRGSFPTIPESPGL